MVWFILTGSVTALVSVVLGWQTGDWHLTFRISGVAFLLSMFAAGIFAGGMPGSPHGHHQTYADEDKEDRWRRRNWSRNLFFLALPNLITLLILIGIAYIVTSN